MAKANKKTYKNEAEVKAALVKLLNKKIKKGNQYDIREEEKIGRRYIADIAIVSVPDGKIREIYEVELDGNKKTIKRAEAELSRYAAYLGKDADVKYFIAFPGKDGNIKIREVLKSDIKENSAYIEEKKEKVVDELKYVSFFIATITAIVLISSIIGWIKFNAVELSLYVIFIGLILLPYAQEINILNLIKFERGCTKTKK